MLQICNFIYNKTPAQVLFVNFVKFVRTSLLQKITRRLLLIIGVSIVVKGKLANETVNCDIKIKRYQFEPEVKSSKRAV